MPLLSLALALAASIQQSIGYACLYAFLAWRMLQIMDSHLHRPVLSILPEFISALTM